jgi:hypothetical protein
MIRHDLYSDDTPVHPGVPLEANGSVEQIRCAVTEQRSLNPAWTAGRELAILDGSHVLKSKSAPRKRRAGTPLTQVAERGAGCGFAYGRDGVRLYRGSRTPLAWGAGRCPP